MTFSLISHADFHQASECLPNEARGRQCVTCSFMFLFAIRKQLNFDLINSEFLHNVMFEGSFLYLALRDLELVDNLVDPEKIPSNYNYHGKNEYVAHTGVVSGFLNTNSSIIDGIVYHSLENAFSIASLKGSCFILVFNGLAQGIYHHNDRFYIFDSHSRNKDGLNCSSGTCIVGFTQSLQDLSSYIKQLSTSLNSCHEKAPNIQFDLHSFVFKTGHKLTPFRIHILKERPGFFIDHFKYRSNKRSTPNNSCENQTESILYNKNSNRKRRISVNKKSTPGSSCESLVRKIELNNKNSNRKRKISTGSFSHPSKQQKIGQEYTSCELIRPISTNESHTIPSSEKIIAKFAKHVLSGPDFVCTVCQQTFFKHSVRLVCNLKNDIEQFDKWLTKLKSVDDKEWICLFCFQSIRSGKSPKLSVHNGLQFHVKPKELELTNLEERLVSPRLPFMQLREMPRGGQVNLKGNIVNVPADVNETMKRLPRMLHDNETIMLKLKRKLSYKHHVAFENIRPNKVFEAARWLVNNSELFKNEGIVLDENWLDTSQGDNHISVTDTQQEIERNQYNHMSECEDDMDERPSGNLDTVLQPVDFREFNQIFSVAPAEHNTPLGLFQDSQSEIFSFPTIYCGQKRKDNSQRNVPLHYSEICKWELRNVDRRVALCVPNIFYKLKKLQIKQIKDKVSLAIRKCKSKGKQYTAGEIIMPGFIENLTMQNDGYRVLRTMRSSPPYWEKAKRDLFAMIRQLGIPTWFCSFSAAETKWIPLLRSLSLLVNGKTMTDSEIEQLSWQEKCHLIKSDPVTCARYFDYRVQSFIRHVLKDKSHPVGDILDFFYRVEFQQRGSPHIHMLIWIKDAPVYKNALDEVVTQFVDRFVTCTKDTTIPTLINYQTHRHARTCKKKHQICRFNFPIPPMPSTVILNPIDGEEDLARCKKEYDKIVEAMSELYQSNNEISFEDFLASVGTTYENYILAIRSSLKRTTLFLKRSPSESRINSYNTTLLKSWQANMDLQFILDPYSCVSYIVSYISKGQRGLSNLLHAACSEAMESETDIRQQVRRIGNQFLSSVEIGAQEAAYLVLQMPLKRSTRTTIFVDTAKSSERTTMLKPITAIKELPKSSTNIEMDNTLKRYTRRPKHFEQLSYADFASWYDLCARRKKIPEKTNDEELPETEYDLDETDELTSEEICTKEVKEMKLLCGTVLKKRQRQKVIYSNLTSLKKDKEEHYREKLMLFTHWRNENIDLIEDYSTYEDSYFAKHEQISLNAAQYENISSETIENMLDNLDSELISSEVNPEGQHQQLIDEADNNELSKNNFFDPHAISEEYDIGQDLGVSRNQVTMESLPHKEMDRDEYLQLAAGLNKEQKTFFYHILHKVKKMSVPFHTFLSGGAGVGKSVVIKAINQALMKHLNHKSLANPNQKKILLCAPTGKAAHNIGGSTLHTAFSIPVSQGFKYKPLDSQQLNKLRAMYHDLLVLIIDEISMVGRNMFQFIDLRLQEIMGCPKPFGNISVLAVGDLFQLKPVMDSWIFSEFYDTHQLRSLSLNKWIELFDFYELKQIMRQKDDQDFALLLNRLREGCHTEDDKAILLSRMVNTNTNMELATFPHLFCTRKDVDLHNKVILEMRPQDTLINIESADDVSGDLDKKLKKTVLDKIPVDHHKTMGLQTRLQLGLGLPCELCLNIDTDDGLTNGASGIVKKFDYRVQNSVRCSIIWVDFDDKCIGKRWRVKYHHLYSAEICQDWTPIFEVCRHFPFQYFKTYLIIRRQFPLYMSAGKTIHKAQGSTMKSLVVDFGLRKTDHLHYVGLSRVTSLSGIYIQQLNFEKISVSADVIMEMERLRCTRQLFLSVPEISNSNDQSRTISFQNCRSLHKHVNCIKQESNLLNSSIVGLVETRIDCSLSNDFLDIPGFQIYNSELQESKHGIAVYIRPSMPLIDISFGTIAGIEYSKLLLENCIIFFVYCPPKMSTVTNFQKFFSVIMKDYKEITSTRLTDLLIMGDFNDDFQKVDTALNSQDLISDFKRIPTECTTDYNSVIDHIYTTLSNEKIEKFGTLESFYSDHKPLFITYFDD